MTNALFKPGRADGRSDARVIFDLVYDQARGSTFSFEAITQALEVGLDGQTVPRSRVYQAVAAANTLLLVSGQRYLNSVKGTGYRLVNPDEHVGLALVRKGRAEVQIRRGLEIVQNTDVSDLTPAQRALHQGQLIVMGALYGAVRGLERRQRKQDQVIAALTHSQSQMSERLAALEAQEGKPD